MTYSVKHPEKVKGEISSGQAYTTRGSRASSLTKRVWLPTKQLRPCCTSEHTLCGRSPGFWHTLTGVACWPHSSEEPLLQWWLLMQSSFQSRAESKWLLYAQATPGHLRQPSMPRDCCRREGRECNSWKKERGTVNTGFWTWLGHCNHERTAAVAPTAIMNAQQLWHLCAHTHTNKCNNLIIVSASCYIKVFNWSNFSTLPLCSATIHIKHESSFPKTNSVMESSTA